MNVPTGFSSKLFMTKRTFEWCVLDALMDHSYVDLQLSFVLVNLLTLGAGIGVDLSLDPLMEGPLVSFQTFETGKVTATDLTGDDNTAIVNLHVRLVFGSLGELLTTELTSVFVLGLTLMDNSDVSLQYLFVDVLLTAVNALEWVVSCLMTFEMLRVFSLYPAYRTDVGLGLEVVMD